MSLRILIADDESPARARLRGLVEELGHEVCAEAPMGWRWSGCCGMCIQTRCCWISRCRGWTG
jgi:hypothetical protein